jgi:PAS domain-containing protein
LSLAFGGFLFIYAPAIGGNLDRPIVIPTLVFGAAVLVIFAVRQNSLFDTLPAARIAARDRLVDSINEAVLLVDTQGRVVELNPMAKQLFDVARSDVNRQPLSEVIPDVPAPADLVGSGDPFRLQADRKRIELTASEVTGEYSNSVGYLLVCRDVTEQRRRERRLRVLTQFLAGTIGERTTTVARQADQLADTAHRSGDDSTSALAREIRQTTESLKEFTTTARRIERLLSDPDAEPTDIVAVTRESTTARAHASLTAEHDESVVVAVDSAVLRAVLDLLIAERLEQGSDHVEITLQSSDTRDTRLTLDFSSSAGPDPHQADETAAEQDSTADPIYALCRLALEHADGELSRPHDDCLQIVFRTDSSTAPEATSAEDASDRPSSRDNHVRVEHVGEQS